MLTAVDASARHVTDLGCERRPGFRFLDSAEDLFRGAERLELESEALGRRYEIFYRPFESEAWLRRLFVPTFILWLAERAPRDFAFELSAGALCASVEGHRDSTAELDALCEAAAVIVERVRSESSE